MTSNANNVHTILAMSKPETAIVTQMAMLARCGNESKRTRIQDVNHGVWGEDSESGAKWELTEDSTPHSTSTVFVEHVMISAKEDRKTETTQGSKDILHQQ